MIWQDFPELVLKDQYVLGMRNGERIQQEAERGKGEPNWSWCKQRQTREA